MTLILRADIGLSEGGNILRSSCDAETRHLKADDYYSNCTVLKPCIYNANSLDFLQLNSMAEFFVDKGSFIATTFCSESESSCREAALLKGYNEASKRGASIIVIVRENMFESLPLQYEMELRLYGKSI